MEVRGGRWEKERENSNYHHWKKDQGSPFPDRTPFLYIAARTEQPGPNGQERGYLVIITVNMIYQASKAVSADFLHSPSCFLKDEEGGFERWVLCPNQSRRGAGHPSLPQALGDCLPSRILEWSPRVCLTPWEWRHWLGNSSSRAPGKDDDCYMLMKDSSSGSGHYWPPSWLFVHFIHTHSSRPIWRIQ